MKAPSVQRLVEGLQAGDVSRRGFVRRATAMGLSPAATSLLVRDAVAQDATTVATPANGKGDVIRSISREEAEREVEEAFPFEDPQNQGGQLIHSMTTDISTVNSVLRNDLYSGWVSLFINEPLARVSFVNGRDVPMGLAHGWEIAEDGYWDTPNIPTIDTYTYQVIADAASAVATLQTGQADVAEVPFAQAEPLRQSNPELQILDWPTLSFNYYYTYQDPEAGLPFTDARVRQALQYALDRDLMAEIVYEGFASRADGIYSELSIAYAPDRTNTIYLYDPEQAGALLDEAGWTPGGDGIREKDGERLSFEMMFSEGVAQYETQVPYMQQAWREVGIEMLPTAIPFPTLSEQSEAGNFHMVLQGLNGTVRGDLSILFASDRMPPDGFNRMRYSNPEYDALVQPSKQELDVEKRIDLLIEQGNIVNDDAAAGLNVFRRDIMGGSARLHNFFPNGYSEVWWVTRAWVEE